MPRRIFITAAEVSGDKHAAGLIRSLREMDPDIVVEGLGGPEMRAAGALLHAETTGGAAMSWHGVKRAGEVWKLLRWTRRRFDQSRFDLQVCVDSPAMNFHFAKAASVRGVPVLYFVAPQLWAWREGRMKKLRKWVDHVACILPFEEKYFRSHGVAATFVGHPLFDELTRARGQGSGVRGRDSVRAGLADSASYTEPRTLNPDPTHPVIGLLPGSRRTEAQANFPPMLDVARRIRAAFPEATFRVPTTPATEPVVRDLLARAADASPLRIEHATDAFDEMVPRCDLCLVVSGTATLHVAAHRVPMIVVYRGSRILWYAVARWLIKTHTYSLVNLLSANRRHIVPEFIPWYGSNAPVADCAIDMLRHRDKLDAQRRRIDELIRSLDKPGAARRCAELAIRLMEANPPRN